MEEKDLIQNDKLKIIELIIEDIKNNKIQMSKNHRDTLYLASVLYSLYGEDGRKYLHIMRKQREGYNEKKINDLFDYCKKNSKNHYSVLALVQKYRKAKQIKAI